MKYVPHFLMFYKLYIEDPVFIIGFGLFFVFLAGFYMAWHRNIRHKSFKKVGIHSLIGMCTVLVVLIVNTILLMAPVSMTAFTTMQTTRYHELQITQDDNRQTYYLLNHDQMRVLPHGERYRQTLYYVQNKPHVIVKQRVLKNTATTLERRYFAKAMTPSVFGKDVYYGHIIVYQIVS